MKYKVRATERYIKEEMKDNELGRIPKPGEEWEVDIERYKFLKSNCYVEFVEEVSEENNQSLNESEGVFEGTLISADDILKNKSDEYKRLKKLKKDELIKEAESLGYIVDDIMTKETLIQMIVNKD